MEYKEFKKLIMESSLELTKFQRLFLCDVNYFNERDGYYSLIPTFMNKKYGYIIDDHSMIGEINNLTDRKLIIVDKKEQYWGGKIKEIMLVKISQNLMEQVSNTKSDIVNDFNLREVIESFCKKNIKRAIENEDYEEAARLRDKLKEFKKEQN